MNLIIQNREPLITMKVAAVRLRCHPATAARHAMDGIRSRRGAKVRLESVRAGAKLLTSEPAIDRFLAALSEGPDDEAQPITPAQRRALDEAANARFGELLAK